ncbi:glucose 1-dehydrogenase [bacterium]|nr:glucose 1-dehydrogenase [bacterium]
MNSLSNKIALVTGGSRGIGAAIAVELAQAGAHVVVNYNRSENKAMDVVRRIEENGGKALPLQADISQISSIQKLFSQIESQWGRVDILINNAGLEVRRSFQDFDVTTYEQIMDTNLKGAFFCAQRAIGGMKEKQWGRIINISSVHELTPTGFCCVYSMSKSGMILMMREMAVEFSQYGITINNIAPGAIRTDINRDVLADPAYEAKVINKIPSRFIGEPEDVAKTAVFLASEDSRYITGTSIFIDGGMQLL